MVLSLAVLLIPIVLIVWFFQRAPDEPNVRAVDWQPAVSQARKDAPYAVKAPAAVPADWKPIKAVWTPKGQLNRNGDPSAGDTLSLGFLNGDQIYISFDQSNAPATQFIADTTRKGYRGEPVNLDGTVWTAWTTADGRTNSLTQTTKDGSTVIVSGDTTIEQISQAATLLG